MESLVGKTLENRFEIIKELPRGSMAAVYIAKDIKNRQKVAIKVLKEDLAMRPKFMSRFKREANTLRKLGHNDIVRIWSFKQTGSFAFISMEYIDGGSLQKRIFEYQGKPMPSKEVLPIFESLCNGLGMAHQERIIHCDIKPDNILLRKDGRAVISDFGIARNAEGSATMEKFGTSAYMGPEQIKGLKPSPGMDIYALGVILYQLTTGKKPFEGDRAKVNRDTQGRIRWEQTKLKPIKPRKINPSITPEMEVIILKCLNKSPKTRYQNTDQLLSDLLRTPIYSKEPKTAPKAEEPTITGTGSFEDVEEESAIQKFFANKYLLGGSVAIIMVLIFSAISGGTSVSGGETSTMGNGVGGGEENVNNSDGDMAVLAESSNVTNTPRPTNTTFVPTATPQPSNTPRPTAIPPLYDCDVLANNAYQYSISTNRGVQNYRQQHGGHNTGYDGDPYLFSIETVLSAGNNSYPTLSEVHQSIFCWEGFAGGLVAAEQFVATIGNSSAYETYYEMSSSISVAYSSWKGDTFKIYFVDRNIAVLIKGKGSSTASDASIASNTLAQADVALENLRGLPVE
jgi:serine/threonine protein kinase